MGLGLETDGSPVRIRRIAFKERLLSRRLQSPLGPNRSGLQRWRQWACREEASGKEDDGFMLLVKAEGDTGDVFTKGQGWWRDSQLRRILGTLRRLKTPRDKVPWGTEAP